MAFQVLVSASGTVSPTASPIGGGSWAPYGFNPVAPGYGAGGAIPSAALVNYTPGCTMNRFVQTIGASGPITNGNLVVDIISNGPNSAGSQGAEPGVPICIVYTVAGGVLT